MDGPNSDKNVFLISSIISLLSYKSACFAIAFFLAASSCCWMILYILTKMAVSTFSDICTRFCFLTFAASIA